MTRYSSPLTADDVLTAVRTCCKRLENQAEQDGRVYSPVHSHLNNTLPSATAEPCEPAILISLLSGDELPVEMCQTRTDHSMKDTTRLDGERPPQTSSLEREYFRPPTTPNITVPSRRIDLRLRANQSRDDRQTNLTESAVSSPYMTMSNAW